MNEFELAERFSCDGELTEKLAAYIQKTRNNDALLTAVASATQESVGHMKKLTVSMNEESNQSKQKLNKASGDVSNVLEATEVVTQHVGSMLEDILKLSQEAAANKQSAAAGTDIIANTQETFSRLVQSGAAIAKVVKDIEGVASQTNLLALNATIEAARAEGFGKGFAVVAEEVKTLAQTTARATHEASERLEQMNVETKAARDTLQVVVHMVAELNRLGESIEETAVTRVRPAQAALQQAEEAAMSVSQTVKDLANSVSSVQDSTLDSRVAVGELQLVAEELQEAASYRQDLLR